MGGGRTSRKRGVNRQVNRGDKVEDDFILRSDLGAWEMVTGNQLGKGQGEVAGGERTAVRGFSTPWKNRG